MDLLFPLDCQFLMIHMKLCMYHLCPISCLNSPSHTHFRSLIISQLKLVSKVLWQSIQSQFWIRISARIVHESVLIMSTVVYVLVSTGWNSCSMGYEVTH